MRIAKTDYEKTAHHLSFSQFAFRLSQFVFSPFAFRNFSIGGCPKTGQAQGPAPTKDIELRIAKCELRIAKTDYEKTAHHFSFSQFAIVMVTIRLPSAR
jgi:hypothetical protein